MQQSPAVKRIVLYARVSSEEQRDGQTIDSQVAELQRHAAERGWIIVGMYKDDGWSGALLVRPDLDRLRDDASKSLFEAVLVNDVDRMARDVAHLGVIKRSLERSGVQLIFRKLPSESSPMRNLMVNILGSFAEFEKEMIADRTRRGRRHKVEVRKQFIGCLPPYGYSYIEKARSEGIGLLCVNEEEALVVRKMYAWVDKEGLSARRVVQRLNNTGVRPRKGALQWAASSVMRVLRRQTYAGIWHYNKYESFEPVEQRRTAKYRRSVKTSLRVRDHSEWIAVPLPQELCLVSSDAWKRVQNRLNQNVSFSKRNSKHSYLLRGLVVCAGCQARFVGEPCHGRFYYRCHRRCKRVGIIQEPQLDEAVWTALKEALLNPELIVRSVLAVQERHVDESKIDHAVANSSLKVLEQLRAEELRILEAYRLAFISAEQLDRELKQLAARRHILEQERAAPERQKEVEVLSETEIKQRVGEFSRQIAKNLAALSPEKKQRLIRLLIDNIVFDGSSVRIRATIPARGQWEPSAFPSDGDTPQSPSGIAMIRTTTPNSYGPNSSGDGGIENTIPERRGRNPSDVGRIENTTPYRHILNGDSFSEDKSISSEIPFMLTRIVARDDSKRLAASLRNLKKASAMRWAGHRRRGDPPLAAHA